MPPKCVSVLGSSSPKKHSQDLFCSLLDWDWLLLSLALWEGEMESKQSTLGYQRTILQFVLNPCLYRCLVSWERFSQEPLHSRCSPLIFLPEWALLLWENNYDLLYTCGFSWERSNSLGKQCLPRVIDNTFQVSYQWTVKHTAGEKKKMLHLW